jgi:TonB family protein
VEIDMIECRANVSKILSALACLAACFVLGENLTAQDTKQVVPAAAENAIKNPPPAAVTDQPKASAVEILTDTQGVGFGPYLQKVVADVRDNWYRLIPYFADAKKGKLAIELAIQKDGHIADTKLVTTSGDASLDRAALESLKAATPFPHLPPEFTGDRLTLRFHFYYYPDKADLQELRAPASTPACSTPSASCLLAKASTGVENLEVVSDTQNAQDKPSDNAGTHGQETIYAPGKDGVTLPRAIYQPSPEFSEEARRKKLDGTVMLSLVVTPDGNTTDIKVTTPLGSGLDEKAIAAVRQWKFEPATKDGKPVAVKIKVEVSFHFRK